MKTRLTLLGTLSIWFVAVALFLLGGGQLAFASTNITVTTTQDVRNGNDGLCSLREAVIAANTDAASGGAAGECPAGNGADTINLPAGVYVLAIPGAGEALAATGDLDINSDITINGALSSTTIIDAAKLDRVMEMTFGVTSQLRNLTLRNGQPPSALNAINSGGGLYVNNNFSAGSVTLEDVTISGNNSSVTGGGIDGGSRQFTLNRVLLYNNTASHGGGGAYIGGAATIASSTVISNATTGGWDGGGLSTNSGPINIKDSYILNNTSSRYGGGFYNYGLLIVENSTIQGNNGSSGAGIFSGGGMITLTKTSIISNTGGAGFYGLDNQFYMYDSLIAQNTGGGINLVNFSGVTAFRNNSFIYRTTLSENYSGLSAYGSGSQSIGGNLWVYDSSIISGTVANALYSSGFVTVTNSTISNNFSSSGAVYLQGSGAKLTLLNSTVVSNTGGAGINHNTASFTNSTLTLANTLVAGNGTDCSGPITSLGYNLIQTTCNLTGTLTGNLVGVNPLLGPLANNGGPTLTHALLAGSPAIDAGDPAGCKDATGALLLSDQRGYPRSVDGNNDSVARCDIGAFERWFPNSFLYLPLIRR